MKSCSEWKTKQKSPWVRWLLNSSAEEDLCACFVAPRGGSISVQSFTWFVFCPVKGACFIVKVATC